MQLLKNKNKHPKIEFKTSSHKSLKWILSLFLGTLFAFGCTNSETTTLVYETLPQTIHSNGIIIKANLIGKFNNNILVLQMQIKNTSKQTIKVDYGNCKLQINTDLQFLPETGKPQKAELKQNEHTSYILTYSPIHSPKFYKVLNYQGDFKQNYYLVTDFLINKSGTAICNEQISFRLSDSLFNKYLTLFGKEKNYKFFDFSFQPDSFIVAQTKFMANNSFNDNKFSKLKVPNPNNHIIQVSDSEILIDNRVIGTECYRHANSLFLKLKLINMGTARFKVLLNKFALNIRGEKFSATAIQSEYFNYNSIADSTIILKQGSRFLALIRFIVPQEYSNFVLPSNWLLLETHGSATADRDYAQFLCCDLLFTESKNK